MGLGYRRSMHGPILASAAEIDWLEIFTDDYLQDKGELDQLKEKFVLVPHGVKMSIGSDSPLDLAYVEAVARLADFVDAPWVSDHLCYTKEGETDIGNLTPMLRTRQKARTVAARAQAVQDRLGRPFILENIAYYMELPGDLTEAQFITEVLEGCDCGLLLDLANVSLNARNHGFDAETFLASLPLERVVHVHLADTAPDSRSEGVSFDSHDAPVGKDVFDLLRLLVRHHLPSGTMIERDDRFPDDFEEILADLRTARQIVEGAST
ncbi:DUF692 domain-containing protein [Nonomuraea sp. KC401]|nr:DUF692 family protein [Nonomuraea sp. K271]TLF81883.1 DUF692 domain-containing protein [Nonomuraea sp. KC401]